MTNDPTNTGYDLSGQVAIITGGGRGLGRAFAQALSAAGAAVAVTARTESQLSETARLIEAAGGRVMAFPADVTDRAAMERVVAEVERRFGPVDILVNNAAVITPLGNEWEVDPDAWWRLMEINVRGPFLCTRTVLPSMMARRRGRIVNISSGAAHAHAPYYPYGAGYCVSKAALSRMTSVLAMAVQEYGIAAFALAVGGPTAMIETVATSPDVPEWVRALFRKGLEDASDSLGQSVRMLLFLVSGQADALTGRHIGAGDPIADLQARQEEIVQNDLYSIRRRE